MRNLILILFTAFIASCGPSTRIEKSEVLHETAKVVSLLYTPSRSHTSITPTMHQMGVVGVDWNGNAGIHVGRGIQVTNTTIPERWGVVFECPHSTFTSEGADIRHQILRDKLSAFVGSDVDVMYQEIYKVTYAKTEAGNDSIISRALTGFDFIDARPLK